jgi:hypothetical protein
VDFGTGLQAALERVNAGAPIATIDPYLVERMWEAFSRIPRQERQQPAGMIGAKLDPSLAPQGPEQKLGMMLRYTLLNRLIERGVLDEYMKDEASRKKVFAAAASMPCDQHDLIEAVAETVLRESPQDVREKKKEELSQAGYDPEQLKVADRFIEWMRINCQ